MIWKWHLLLKGGYFLHSDLDSPNEDPDSDALGSESENKSGSFPRKAKGNAGLRMDLKAKDGTKKASGGVASLFSGNKAWIESTSHVPWL